MPKMRSSAEQIITHVCEAEVLLAKGRITGEVCRHLGIHEQTYYRGARSTGGLEVEQAKRLKQLEAENARLQKLVVDLALDAAVRAADRGRRAGAQTADRRPG